MAKPITIVDPITMVDPLPMVDPIPTMVEFRFWYVAISFDAGPKSNHLLFSLLTLSALYNADAWTGLTQASPPVTCLDSGCNGHLVSSITV